MADSSSGQTGNNQTGTAANAKKQLGVLAMTLLVVSACSAEVCLIFHKTWRNQPR